MGQWKVVIIMALVMATLVAAETSTASSRNATVQDHAPKAIVLVEMRGPRPALRKTTGAEAPAQAANYDRAGSQLAASRRTTTFLAVGISESAARSGDAKGFPSTRTEPLAEDDVAERLGVMAGLGQTYRAIKQTMLKNAGDVVAGAGAAIGAVGNTLTKLTKAAKIVFDANMTSSTTTATSDTTTPGS